MTLAERVLRQLQTQEIAMGVRLIVGISGGPDSLALLHILHSLRERYPLRLHVATLDHGLRGPASAADADFVVQIAEAWGLDWTRGSANLNPDAPGTEAEARRVRYAFLAQVAREIGAGIVAVGHHADDQAETVLMHLLRGGGIKGLGGMDVQAALPDDTDLRLIRPLLSITRAEIDAYCAEHALGPRHDASNDDLNPVRNRLRHDLLPRLRDFNPKVDKALNRLAAIARLEDDLIESLYAVDVAPYVEREESLRVTLPLKIYQALHPALHLRFLYASAKELGAEAGYHHLAQAARVLDRGAVGAEAPLSSGIRVRLGYDTISIERSDAPLPVGKWPLLPENTRIPVVIPGETRTPGGWVLRVDRAGPGQARLYVPPGAEVLLRTRQSGDVIAPVRLKGHTQTIKKWMIDKKVPRHLRNNVPLLIIDRDIAAILLGDHWELSFKFTQESEFLNFSADIS